MSPKDLEMEHIEFHRDEEVLQHDPGKPTEGTISSEKRLLRTIDTM